MYNKMHAGMKSEGKKFDKSRVLGYKDRKIQAMKLAKLLYRDTLYLYTLHACITREVGAAGRKTYARDFLPRCKRGPSIYSRARARGNWRRVLQGLNILEVS